MYRWLWALMPLGPIGYGVYLAGGSRLLVFALSTVGIVPLAALIGKATEELAYYVGSSAGGLLNATFGNVPELIIGILAIRDGLVTLAQASIIGSVIGNASLVVGMSLFYGGIRNGVQTFSRDIVGHHAVLMVLAIASLALPTLFLSTTPRGNVEALSIFVAILLIATYAAYMVYDIGGFRGGRHRRRDGPLLSEGGERDETLLSGGGEAVEEIVEDEGGPDWSPVRASVWLGVATLITAFVADALVASVKPTVEQIGVSQFFIGVILVPIVGNVAEHYAAVTLAGKDKMDLSFAVASASSVQVAVFVAPVLVLVSLFWHPMTLVFNPIEIAVLALVVTIFFFVSQDGESNWLEGLQLMMLYAMSAAVFYFLPGPQPG